MSGGLLLEELRSKRLTSDQIAEEIRAIKKLAHNSTCFDCGARGPTYVNTTINTFVCGECSGILRSLNHRLKSLSMSSFSLEELAGLISGGNSAAKRTWLATYDPSKHFMKPRVHYNSGSSSDVKAFGEWMRLVYVEKRFARKPSAAASAAKKSSQKKAAGGKKKQPLVVEEEDEEEEEEDEEEEEEDEEDEEEEPVQVAPKKKSAPAATKTAKVNANGKASSVTAAPKLVSTQKKPQLQKAKTVSNAPDLLDSVFQPKPVVHKSEVDLLDFGNFNVSSPPVKQPAAAAAPPMMQRMASAPIQPLFVAPTAAAAAPQPAFGSVAALQSPQAQPAAPSPTSQMYSAPHMLQGYPMAPQGYTAGHQPMGYPAAAGGAYGPPTHGGVPQGYAVHGYPAGYGFNPYVHGYPMAYPAGYPTPYGYPGMPMYPQQMAYHQPAPQMADAPAAAPKSESDLTAIEVAAPAAKPKKLDWSRYNLNDGAEENNGEAPVSWSLIRAVEKEPENAPDLLDFGGFTASAVASNNNYTVSNNPFEDDGFSAAKHYHEPAPPLPEIVVMQSNDVFSHSNGSAGERRESDYLSNMAPPMKLASSAQTFTQKPMDVHNNFTYSAAGNAVPLGSSHMSPVANEGHEKPQFSSNSGYSNNATAKAYAMSSPKTSSYLQPAPTAAPEVITSPVKVHQASRPHHRSTPSFMNVEGHPYASVSSSSDLFGDSHDPFGDSHNPFA
eukprot:TRINITY_DN380_c0_g1_i1.p1 TRINITY_DN380_c0_g1~~TRINITY_DN380_c0_g1_i1.p1  ORF type:complete len:722 (-),score=228.60 TRINITY_DN380_c0_g1_i1:117-2282(-)